MKDKRDSLHETPVRIAITGDSGSGKSTLINTLRGIGPNDLGAAKVGTVETTLKVTPYEHPYFKNVVLFDLPGVGSPNFPQSSYKKAVDLPSYDFFIIMISNRFSENALWLAKTLKKIRKPFFFVRSKFDIDLAMKKKHNPKISEQQVMDEIRNDITSNLKDLTDRIFIVSGEIENTDRWDLIWLKQQMIEALPDVKKNIIIVSLGGYAKELIDTKYQVLKRRILFYAGFSAAGALAPVPLVSVGIDTALLLQMANEFSRALGLQEQQIESHYNNITQRTKVIAIMGHAGALLTAKGIVKYLTKHTTSALIEEFVRYVPVIGQGIAGGLSFATTYHAGKSLLDIFRDLAYQMAEEVVDYQLQKAELTL